MENNPFMLETTNQTMQLDDLEDFYSVLVLSDRFVYHIDSRIFHLENSHLDVSETKLPQNPMDHPLVMTNSLLLKMII